MFPTKLLNFQQWRTVALTSTALWSFNLEAAVLLKANSVTRSSASLEQLLTSCSTTNTPAYTNTMPSFKYLECLSSCIIFTIVKLHSMKFCHRALQYAKISLAWTTDKLKINIFYLDHGHKFQTERSQQSTSVKLQVFRLGLVTCMIQLN